MFIPDPDFDFLPIPHPGVKRRRIPIRNTAHNQPDQATMAAVTHPFQITQSTSSPTL
jgi:hypothetical protein